MNLSFSTSVLILRMVIWLAILWTLMGLYLMGSDLWHFWLAYRPKEFNTLLDPTVARGLLGPLKALGWQMLADLKVVAIGLVFKAVWRRLPIPDRLVQEWAQDAALHPIAGRMLVRSLRWHGRLNVRRTLWISEGADAERYFTHKALKRTGSRELFERFPLADSVDDPR